MTVQVLYFAGLVELVGTHQEQLELSSALSMGEFVAMLTQKHPRLVLEGVRFALNEEFVDAAQTVAAGDVVALIPPVSGG